MRAPIRVVALAHAFPRTHDDPVGLFVAQLAIALRVRVVTNLPNPGSNVSCRLLVPNGWNSSASNVLNRVTN